MRPLNAILSIGDATEQCTTAEKKNYLALPSISSTTAPTTSSPASAVAARAVSYEVDLPTLNVYVMDIDLIASVVLPTCVNFLSFFLLLGFLNLQLT